MAQQPTLFVIGEDPDVREPVERLATDGGYRSVLFASAEEFLASDVPKADGCVLADMELPGMDGLALQKEMARRQINLCLILVAREPKTADVVHAIRSGAVDFLEKPLNRDSAYARIQEAMRHTQPSECEPPVASRISLLTPREREVMDLLAQGKQTKQIAKELTISPKTVEKHRSKVLHKMQVHTVVELVRTILQRPAFF